VQPWTLHDLRRTFASDLASLGVRIEVIEKLLNHVSGSFAGVAGIYQRHTYLEEMRAAVAAWERHIDGVLRQHWSAAEKRRVAA
jgi:integrase